MPDRMFHTNVAFPLYVLHINCIRNHALIVVASDHTVGHESSAAVQNGRSGNMYYRHVVSGRLLPHVQPPSLMSYHLKVAIFVLIMSKNIINDTLMMGSVKFIIIKEMLTFTFRRIHYIYFVLKVHFSLHKYRESVSFTVNLL